MRLPDHLHQFADVATWLEVESIVANERRVKVLAKNKLVAEYLRRAQYLAEMRDTLADRQAKPF